MEIHHYPAFVTICLLLAGATGAQPKPFNKCCPSSQSPKAIPTSLSELPQCKRAEGGTGTEGPNVAQMVKCLEELTCTLGRNPTQSEVIQALRFGSPILVCTDSQKSAQPASPPYGLRCMGYLDGVDGAWCSLVIGRPEEGLECFDFANDPQPRPNRTRGGWGTNPVAISLTELCQNAEKREIYRQGVAKATDPGSSSACANCHATRRRPQYGNQIEYVMPYDWKCPNEKHPLTLGGKVLPTQSAISGRDRAVNAMVCEALERIQKEGLLGKERETAGELYKQSLCEASLYPTLQTGISGGVQLGRITSTPSGIYCVPGCEKTFRIGTRVTLTASPSPGARFIQWTAGPAGQGCDKVSGNECTVTLDGRGRRHVLATFQADEAPRSSSGRTNEREH